MIQADTLKPGWKLVKFGDVVRLSKERATKSEIESIERYVGLEHIDPEDLRIRRWGLVAEGITFTSKFKPGQVLFGKRRAYQRKVAVADFEGVCSGDIYVFESANPKVLLPELLPFICQTDRFFEYAVGTSSGSLSPRTNWTSLAKFEFTLPTLEEQIKFIKILKAIEQLIYALLHCIDMAQKAGQSLSIRYFSQTQDAHENFILDSNFSKLPLSDLCCLIKDGTHLPPKRVQEGTWLLGVTNLVEGELVLTNSDTKISDNFYAEMHKNWIPLPGDVLLAIVGATIGKTAIIPNNFPKFTLQRSVAVLRGKSGLLDNNYLHAFFDSPVGQSILWQKVHQTAQPGLYLKDIAAIKIPVPPFEKQQEIAEHFRKLRKVRKTCMYQVKKIKQFKSLILNQIMK
jgi:type I restriction enzyme S subunit